jgi:hypothetical protein
VKATLPVIENFLPQKIPNLLPPLKSKILKTGEFSNSEIALPVDYSLTVVTGVRKRILTISNNL